MVGSWLIALSLSISSPVSIPTLPAGQEQVTQTVNLTYEPTSVELKSITVEPNPANVESDSVSGFTLTSSFGRDERGSVTSETEEGSGSTRSVTIGFDPNDADRIFPVTLTDALGHSVSSYPDAVFGLPQAGR